MGLFSSLKKAADSADKTLKKTREDVTVTADKIQKTLDESGKGVQIVMKTIVVTLCVSILTNFITVGLNLISRKPKKPSIVIHNLYLGDHK